MMYLSENYNDDFLSQLIDHRREEPEVEYKCWLDLSQNVAKSKIAKHICAIANYGGGWLIFGVNDDGTHSDPHPGNLSDYSQDVINNISQKYLTPSPHCSVFIATSRVTGKTYPAIRIPSHGVTPICAKINGPVENKDIVGVTQGTHYIRMSGPKSVRIDTPELWRDVLHRCVINERERLLSSIGRLFDRPAPLDRSPTLDTLIDGASSHWNEVVPQSGWPVRPNEHRVIFAFQLLNEANEPPKELPLKDLRLAHHAAANAADEAIQIGWTFGLHADGDHAPKVGVFEDVEGYEATMVASDGHYVSVPTMWRATANGRGFEVRLQPEDSSWLASSLSTKRGEPWRPGTCLSPSLQCVRMFQFLVFVRSLASNFPGAQKIEVGVDYVGLSGRRLHDPDPATYYSISRTSTTNSRRYKLALPLEKLSGDGSATVTSEILSPVFRLFDGWEITPRFVVNLFKRVGR